jgi:hypothetical protein
VTAASPIIRRSDARRAVAFFVQAALRELAADVGRGEEVPFALDARSGPAGPALYEYRPLYRAYAEARVRMLERLPDFAGAVAALASDPAVMGVARDHAPDAASDEDAVRNAILIPLVAGVAEGCGAFEYDDRVFAGIFDRMLADVAQTRRSFTAFTPVIGLRAADGLHDLGQGVTMRRVQATELAETWPECQGLLPERFTIARDRMLGLELDVAMPRGAPAEPPDAARRFARAVLALRLVFGGPVAVGPCLFERVDWSPRAVRALPPAVTQVRDGAEPVRLDAKRLGLVRALVDRIGDAEVRGGAVSVALARWASASAALVPAERATGLMHAVEPLLAFDGAGPWGLAMRAAALIGDSGSEREELAATIAAIARLARPDAPLADVPRLAEVADDVARATLAAALDQGEDALRLPDVLDAVLLGARPRPQIVSGLSRSA